MLIFNIFSSSRTSYTIDESSSCSASSSLSSRTMTTMAKSTTSRHNHHPHQHHQLQYDNVQGFLRPQSIAASCSSLYETIVETGVNKFPMQTMHSNKTCKYTTRHYNLLDPGLRASPWPSSVYMIEGGTWNDTKHHKTRCLCRPWRC